MVRGMECRRPHVGTHEPQGQEATEAEGIRSVDCAPRLALTAGSLTSSAASRSHTTAGSALSARSTAAASRRTSTSRSTPSVRPSRSLEPYDPRLLDGHVKQEPQLTPPMQPANLSSMPRGQAPVMPYVAMAFRPPMMRTPYFSPRHDSAIQRAGFFPSYGYGELARPSAYVESMPTSATPPSKLPGSPRYSDEDGNHTKAVEDPPDNSKLKGILWPGMSIFDSATPVARRRRNQKKDASILEQLENNSLDVEPTERVWTPGGSLKKSKDISGLPSSSSPPASPTKPSIRRPLSDVDPRLSWDYKNGLGYSTYEDDRIDDALTFGVYDDQGKRRKRSFQIWHDETTNQSTAVHPGQNLGQFGYLDRAPRVRPARGNENDFTFTDRQPTVNPLVKNDVMYKSEEGTYDRVHHRFRGQPSYAGLNPIHRDATLPHAANFANLLVAAEGATNERPFLGDPFFVGHHAQEFGPAYESGNVLSSGTSALTRPISSSARRHHPSLSIEALLIGGCPTTATDPADAPASSSHGHLQDHTYGFSPSHPFGFGIPMASPARAHTPSQDWTALWHGMTSNPTGHGFWTNHNGEAPSDQGDTQGAVIEEEHVKPMRSPSIDGKSREHIALERDDVKPRSRRNVSQDRGDDEQTLSAPRSTPNH
jgi:hypothetical protein